MISQPQPYMVTYLELLLEDIKTWQAAAVDQPKSTQKLTQMRGFTKIVNRLACAPHSATILERFATLAGTSITTPLRWATDQTVPRPIAQQAVMCTIREFLDSEYAALKLALANNEKVPSES